MRCFACQSEIPEPMVVRKNGRWTISGEWAVHWLVTHGMPMELFEMCVNKLLERGVTS